ncbi:hypothetical protein [Halomonas caseinilytica]|uniref:hypothetical protein n=1 Tax=Halomonas caseinilytica TaxID=438744 RepID=UPI0008492EFA|nr:hypothetical protein [Halomonas caseinilytica]
MQIAQINKLADIQGIACAAHEQTGHQTRHEVETFSDGGVWSTVGVYDRYNERVYHSRVSIEPDGSERRLTGETDGPGTLAEQAVQLAEWIAANRKEVAA